MIASAKKIHQGSSRESYHSKPEEYHIQGPAFERNEAIGFFLGNATKQCGLFDAPIYPHDERVRDLFEGKHPVSGERLRQDGARPKNRTYFDKKTQKEKIYRPVSGIDFTHSLPKSVSVLWAVSSEKTQASIIRALRKTTHDWMEKVEESIGITRTGAGGKNRERVSLFASAYTHFTSRSLEPQLHVHCVIYSVGVRSNGKGGTLNLSPVLTPNFIYGEGQRFRDLFKTHLAHELRDYRLSFRDEKIKNGTTFQIDGIPKGLCQAWSSRRADIENRLRNIPDPTALDVQKAVLAGRKKKNRSIHQSKLFAVWREIAAEHGFNAETFLKGLRDRKVLSEEERLLPKVSFKPSRRKEAEGSEKKETHHRKEAEGSDKRETHHQKKTEGSKKRETQHRKDTEGSEKRETQHHYKEVKQPQEPPPKKQPISRPKQKLHFGPLPPSATDVRERWAEGVIRNLARDIRDRITPEWLRPVDNFEKELLRARELAAQRREQFLRRITFLYAIGKVSRKTYLRHKKGQGLPRTKLGIELRYWSGQSSLAERIYLRIKEGHGTPEFGVPKSRFGINLAAAMGQVSRSQQLLLLERYGHAGRSPNVLQNSPTRNFKQQQYRRKRAHQRSQ